MTILGCYRFKYLRAKTLVAVLVAVLDIPEKRAYERLRINAAGFSS